MNLQQLEPMLDDFQSPKRVNSKMVESKKWIFNGDFFIWQKSERDMWIGIDTFEGAMMNLNEYRGRGFGGLGREGGGGEGGIKGWHSIKLINMI